MLQPVFEYSSVQIADDLLMGAKTVRQTAPPLTFVVLNELICFRVARRQTKPVKFSKAVLLAVHELAQIKVAIGINFNTISVFLIPIELTFIDLAILRYIDALSLPFLVSDQPEVDLPIVLHQLKVRVLHNFLKRKPFLREELIVSKKVAKLLLAHSPYVLHVPLLLDCMDPKDLNV